ncbi:MAG: DUF2238 domain-containing protein [Planctomycetota bacterium]|nr:MAG: DUF2238 domain-containing protein [Planctomycetota bacterium]
MRGDPTPLLRRQDRPVAIFFLLVLAVALAGCLLRRSGEFLFYFAVLLVLATAVLAVHRQVRLHAATLWCLSLWGLLHMAGGLVSLPGGRGVLYNLWLVPGRIKYDQVVHAFGFGVTTWVCWQALARMLGDPRPSIGRLALCAAAGMGFGALNEVVEFTATLLVPETNVGGYANTGWDLVANLTGCVVAAVLIFRRRRSAAAS